MTEIRQKMLATTKICNIYMETSFRDKYLLNIHKILDGIYAIPGARQKTFKLPLLSEINFLPR